MNIYAHQNTHERNSISNEWTCEIERPNETSSAWIFCCGRSLNRFLLCFVLLLTFYRTLNNNKDIFIQYYNWDVRVDKQQITFSNFNLLILNLLCLFASTIFLTLYWTNWFQYIWKKCNYFIYIDNGNGLYLSIYQYFIAYIFLISFIVNLFH